jgi:hypothetical protein
MQTVTNLVSVRHKYLIDQKHLDCPYKLIDPKCHLPAASRFEFESPDLGENDKTLEETWKRETAACWYMYLVYLFI